MGERRMEMGFEMEENVICMGGGPKRRATEKTKSNVQGGV